MFQLPAFLSDVSALLGLLLAILVFAVLLFLSIRIVTKRKGLSGGYFFMLLLVATVGVIAVPTLQIIASLIRIPQIAPIIVYIALLYLVRYLLPYPGGSDRYYDKHYRIRWENTIWIVFICLLSVYLVNALTSWAFGVRVIPTY